MPSPLPSAEQILQATSPEDLFGPNADDLSVRRTYGRLIRAYTPEDAPEVFQHIRSLYEAARASARAVAEPEEAPLPVLLAAPDRLQQAVAAEDWQTVFRVLAEEHRALIGNHDDLFVEAFDGLVCMAGPSIGAGALDTLELLLARPELEIQPARHARLEVQLCDLRGLLAVATDEAVHLSTQNLVYACWCRRADALVRFLPEVLEDMAAGGVDLGEALSHLETRHPAAFAQLLQAELRVTGCGDWYADYGAMSRGMGRLPDAVRHRWRQEVPHGLQIRSSLKTREVPDRVWGLFAWYTLGWLGFVLLNGSFSGLEVMSVVWGALAVVAAGLAYVEWARISRLRARVMPQPERLVELARAHGLWPHELVSELADTLPIVLDRPNERTTLYAYQDEHPLLRFERDPSSWLRVLTPQHVSRVEARYAQDAAVGEGA